MMERYYGVYKDALGKLEVREFDSAAEAQNHCELLDMDYVCIKDNETKTKEYQERIKQSSIDLAVDDYIKKKTKHIEGI